MNEHAYPIGFKFYKGEERYTITDFAGDKRYIIRVEANPFSYIVEERYIDECFNHREQEAKQDTQKKQKTYTEDDMVSFALHFVDGEEEEIRSEILIWEEQKNKKREKEYQEYLRLKKIFGE